MLEERRLIPVDAPPRKSEQLINALKAQQPKALACLYDGYHAALYGSILRIVTQKSVAEEVLQDVFLAVWRNIDSYNEARGSLFTWMLNIARNKSIDALRLMQCKHTLTTTGLEEWKVQEAFNPYRFLDLLDFEKHLSSLSATEKVILELIFFRGYTCKETAQLLKMPLGSVKTKMQKSYKTLRSQLVKQ